MEIRYEKQPQKYLRKLHKPKRLQLVKAINAIPNGNIKKMKGFNALYRLRVNDYRVIFSENGDIIMIEKIGSRGDIYNGN